MKVKQILTGKTQKIVPMLVIVMIALAGGYAIASVYFRLNLSSTVLVLSFEIETWNEAMDTQIIALDFGVMMMGEAFTTEPLVVKNVGDSTVWFAWIDEDIPEGFMLICEYENLGSWTNWPALGFGIGPNIGLASGEFCTYPIRFTLANIDASSGEYPFALHIDSASTESG